MIILMNGKEDAIMKKYLSILCAVAVALGAVSCQKADEVKTSATVNTPLKTITVRIADNGTRLALDEETHYTKFELTDQLFGWDATGNYTYICTKAEANRYEFKLLSEYAPSSEPGTKVNLIFANGYDVDDIDGGQLSLDIKNQNASGFSQLPIVMTGQGIVAQDGGCEVVFNNETSYISIKDCPTPAAGGMSFYSVEATNLYPQMTISIDKDGNFVKTIGQAGTITNGAEIVSSQDKKISSCMATFPSPAGAAAANVVFSAESAEGIDYYYGAGKKTVPANKIISISGKEFTSEPPVTGIAELVETGESFTDFSAAVAAANAYEGSCTIKMLQDFTNSTAQTITNTAGATLNLNGYSFTVSGKSTRISIASGSSLTIDGEGTYTIATATNIFALTNENSTLILKGGTISISTGTYAAIYSTTGSFEMYGGEVNTNGNKALAIDFEAPAKMKLNGGTIKGGSAKHGAIYVANANADVEIDGTQISAPHITANDNPVLNLVSGKLALKSGKIGSSSDRWGIKVGNGSFEMTGGTVSASRYPVYCAGTGNITISGGCIIDVNAGWKAFYGSSDAKNSVKLTGGYFYAHHNASYPGFYTFGGTLTDMSVEVSGGYFAEDISSTSAGYKGKITINGEVEECSDVKDVHGNKYTHQVVPVI